MLPHHILYSWAIDNKITPWEVLCHSGFTCGSKTIVWTLIHTLFGICHHSNIALQEQMSPSSFVEAF